MIQIAKGSKVVSLPSSERKLDCVLVTISLRDADGREKICSSIAMPVSHGTYAHTEAQVRSHRIAHS